MRKGPPRPQARGPDRGFAGARHLGLIGNILVNIAVLVAVAVGGGLGTAWYTIEAGSRLSTRSFGPWISWTAAGRPEADPYTRAHTVRNGLLPLSSTLEITYLAKTDSRGGRLTSACDYAIVVEGMDEVWWSLAAFNGAGGLISNPAERYSFTSDTAMREPDGRAIITLARDARPGNWLPIGGGNRINLVLTVQDPATAATMHETGTAKAPPPIQRMSCR